MIGDWYDSNNRLFVVLADAGMGKSVFAASLIRNLRAKNQLLACYFCKHNDKERSSG